MPAYVAGINDTAVGGLAGYAADDVDAAKAWLERGTTMRPPGDAFFFAVCELGDDRFVGTTWLKEVNWSTRTRSWPSTWIRTTSAPAGDRCPAHAAALRVRWPGAQRVWLTVDADNARAIARTRRSASAVRESCAAAGGVASGELAMRT